MLLSLAACGKEGQAEETPTPAAAEDTGLAKKKEAAPTAAPTLEPIPTLEPTPTPVPEPEALTIITDNIEIESDAAKDAGVEVNCSRMTVANNGYDGLKKTIDELNATYSNLATETAEYFLSDMEGLSAEEIDMWYIDITSNIERLDEDVTSVVYTMESYLGGAHPSFNIFTANIDTQTGEIIKLLDLAGNGYEYSIEYDALERAVLYELEHHENADGFFPGFNETVHEMFNNDAADAYTDPVYNHLLWTLYEDRITFYFDTYVLGPYVCGPYIVDVPFKDGHVAYTGLSDSEIFSLLEGEWMFFSGEVDGYTWIQTYDENYEPIEKTSITFYADGTANYYNGATETGRMPATVTSWTENYYTTPGMYCFSFEQSAFPDSTFSGYWDGENFYLYNEIYNEEESYHVGVYMVFQREGQMNPTAWCSVVEETEEDFTLMLQNCVYLLSWDDPQELAKYGVTQEDFFSDYMIVPTGEAPRYIKFDKYYPPVLRVFDYYQMDSREADVNEFLQRVYDCAGWNDGKGMIVEYVNGLYGPVCISETYQE